MADDVLKAVLSVEARAENPNLLHQTKMLQYAADGDARARRSR